MSQEEFDKLRILALKKLGDIESAIIVMNSIVTYEKNKDIYDLIILEKSLTDYNLSALCGVINSNSNFTVNTFILKIKIFCSFLNNNLEEAEFYNTLLLENDDDYWITQRITRGVRGDLDKRPTLIIECYPLPFQERARFYREGINVAFSSVRRTPPQSMSPRVKMHNYVNMVQAELEVKALNPDSWPILLDINGNICNGKVCDLPFI